MPKPEQVSAKRETVMDVTVEQLARVYAKAFLGAAAKASKTDNLVDELKSLVADVLNRNPKLEQVLESSLVSPEQKETLIDRVLGKAASVQLVNFLKVLSRHGRLKLIRPIARQAEKLHTEQSGLADVEVRVARELDPVLQQELFDRIQKGLGKTPRFNVKIDPKLIAGIVVRVGDRVFDGSLSTRLDQARQSMISRATEQIELGPDRFVSAK